jgi:hypothetical protein
MRAAWLVAGALATVIALLLSTVGIWRGFARARVPVESAQRSIPFTGGKIELKAVAGRVDMLILPGQAGELLIARTLRWSGERPGVTEDWDADASTLRLKALCPGAEQPDGPICQAEYMIFVPPETDIVAGTTRGDLAVNDVFGSVRLTSVSGNVRLTDVSGTVWARTDTGSIDADRIDGETADVEVGSGDVYLSFVNPPTSVRAVVRTRGDVSVNVPTGSYDVTADAPNITTDLRKDKDSPRKILATTKAGSVSLCCR